MGQFRNLLISRQQDSYTELMHCFLNESPVQTDIKITSNVSRITLSISFNGDISTQFFCFGARATSTSTDKLYIRTSANRFNFYLGENDVVYLPVTDLSERTDLDINSYLVTYTNSNITNSISVGDEYGFVDCDYPLCIGGLTNGSQIATQRMIGYFWGCEIYIDDVLSHEIIPAKDSNDVICLVDKKTNKLYYPISDTEILPDEPIGFNTIDPGSLQMNLNDNDELDVEPTDDEEEER